MQRQDNYPRKQRDEHKRYVSCRRIFLNWKGRIKVNGACPGFTKTALNNFQGTKTVEEGAREPVRLALLGDDGPTATYSNDEGPLPW